MIPKVRPYRARLVSAKGAELARAAVSAPTRLFARWAARDEFMAQLGGTAYARMLLDEGARLIVSPIQSVRA
jgi:hypothetical protein